MFFDLAEAQDSAHRSLAYRRAGATILGLDTAIHTLAAGGLPKLPNIGPSSSRIVYEFLQTGRSETVARTVQASRRRERIEARQASRGDFLSYAAVVEIMRTPRSRGTVDLAEYRGDLQMHSAWSDGAASIETVGETCRALGHQYAAVTDHSHGLAIAGGMTMEEVGRQHAEIDRLNDRWAGGFRVVKGIEANIGGDGSLDLSLEERRQFELVVASPHALLRRPDDQTARMVKAVSSPGVAILGHPRGRRFSDRAGVQADWEQVFVEAARRGVAIEIDGYFDRQDVDYRLASLALECGCLLALDSDAHAPTELRFSEYAIAHARLAGAPAERVVNYWPVDRLLAWARER